MLNIISYVKARDVVFKAPREDIVGVVILVVVVPKVVADLVAKYWRSGMHQEYSFLLLLMLPSALGSGA